MAGRYDRELEMELEQEFGSDFADEFELPYDPDEADASAASTARAKRELYAKYQAACKGRRILKRLSRQKLDLYDEALMLQARIAGLPNMFRELADLRSRLPKPTDAEYPRKYAEYQQRYAAWMARLGYNPAEALGTLEEALAQARCEQAFNTWQWVGP